MSWNRLGLVKDFVIVFITPQIIQTIILIFIISVTKFQLVHSPAFLKCI